MTGHRATLTAMQVRALAKPIRFEDRERPDWLTSEREAEAKHISNPAIYRWQQRKVA